MSDSHKNPVCLITGGTSGVGLAVALEFGRRGYCIATCGRDEAALNEAHKAISEVAPDCEVLQLELSEPGKPRKFVDKVLGKFNRLDVLVNNAGNAPKGGIENFPAEEFKRCLAVNVEAVFHCTQAVWPQMKGQKKGIIINISSLASVDPFPGFSVYGGCKAWVNLFTKAIADEGKPLGIQVFSVALGAVETKMLRGLFPDFPDDQTLSPKEVAEFIGKICEEPFHHATGQTFFLKK